MIEFYRFIFIFIYLYIYIYIFIFIFIFYGKCYNNLKMAVTNEKGLSQKENKIFAREGDNPNEQVDEAEEDDRMNTVKYIIDKIGMFKLFKLPLAKEVLVKIV